MSHLSEEQLDKLVDEERARDYEPLNEWRTIAARAKEEGLILGSEPRGWSANRPWLQAAAAVLILVSGIVIGRSTHGLPGDTPNSDAVASTTPSGNAVASGVSEQPKVATGESFASVDDASATLARALTDYQRASAYLAANNSSGVATTTDSSRLYQNRLAALEQVRNAMEGALRTAPHDPVINQYYLATMGARVATQQMVARPVSLALRGF